MKTFTTYEEFERHYRRTHTAQFPRRPKAAVHGWVKRMVWFLAFVGAAVFGGAHTIPVAVRTMPAEFFPDETIKRIIGAFTWLFVEFSIFGAGFVGGRKEPEDADKRVRITPSGVILSVALMVAIATTAYSGAVEMYSTDQSDLFGVLIATLMGISAPIIAWQAGDMFHRMTQDDNRAQAEADKTWKDDLAVYEKKVLTAWTNYQKRNNIESDAEVPAETPVEAPQNAPGASQRHENAPTGTNTLKERLDAHFAQYPHDLAAFMEGTLKGKDIADAFGVTPAAVSQYKRGIKEGNF